MSDVALARTYPRYLEVLPGVFSWTLITFPIWGSIFMPQVVAYFIIAFNVFWLYKSITLGVISTMSYFRIKASKKNDWLKEVQQLKNWEKVHHLIIIPTYKEPVETLRSNLHHLHLQDYPKDKLHIVLGFEKREREAKKKAAILEREFGSEFGDLWATFHPDVVGEVKGKSSNEAFAGKWAKNELVDKRALDIDWMTISSVDADANFHEKYFSALAYEFLTQKDRYRLFFQPVVVFYNNIWRVPAPIRVVNTFNNIWNTGKLSRSDRLINCSTYSSSLKMISDVGFWDVDVIPEDYRIFFKCYFTYDGNVSTVPIFLPVSLDAAEGRNYWGSMVNQYEQLKRWAYGASDDPYVIMSFWNHAQGNFIKKSQRVFQLMEEHFFWPVNWFIITLGATIPVLVNPNFKTTALGQNLSTFPSFILSFTLITLVVILIIDSKQRPPRPAHISLTRRWLMNLEFFLMPIVGFFFSALPGLDAHTRLMFGKYMEYRVTEKVAR